MVQIPKNFKTAFSESAYELVRQNREGDLEYQRLEAEQSQLFHRILESLGEENSRLLFQLEEVQNDLGSLDADLIYLQGMIDSASLLRAMKLI